MILMSTHDMLAARESCSRSVVCGNIHLMVRGLL